jgi:hypothetical protein
MQKRHMKEAKARPGDWMKPARGGNAPAGQVIPMAIPDMDAVYESLESPGDLSLTSVMKSVESGKAVIDDATLFCGRFNSDGRLLRESKLGARPYRMLRLHSPLDYKKAMRESKAEWDSLPEKEKSARRKREAASKVKKALRENFVSNSDLGSTNELDPNQFTEFTPYFSGPYYKQQYFDYFKGHARAFQQWTHNPVAKRIVDILIQYALGRGFKVKCKDPAKQKKWEAFQQKNKIQYKMRKFWGREYLIYGENFIDVLRWVSVDPSTIWDIICEGYDEYIDNVLYYHQMYQTATQMYAGMSVKGVAGSKDSKIGHYIVRQIPYDQIIHIKTNVTSGEKRGRSVYYSILGWLKRLVDLYNAQVLGEQLRASFVWDDTIQGDSADVSAHAAKYAYIPVAPSIFVHNEAITRKPLAPMAGVTGGAGGDIGQEILALIATSVGIPKDHLNVTSAGGSRATAIVGSEPFTKVIEDLQEDFSDLLERIIEEFCKQSKLEYIADEWKKLFPSVTKDAISEVLKNIAMRESMGWISKRQAATLAASECDDDEYDYDEMVKEQAKDTANEDPANLHKPKLPPAGRFGGQAASSEDEGGDSPIHGKGKQDIKKQHKNL